MKKALLTAFVVPAVFLTILGVATKASANEIASKGASHNGVFLFASKTDMQGRGMLIRLAFDCRKNWNGRASGVATVIAVNLKTNTTQETTLRCSVDGPPDGATNKSSTNGNIVLAGAGPDDVFLVPQLEHTALTATELWGKNIENAFKGRVDQLVDAFTGGGISGLRAAASRLGIPGIKL